MKLFNIDVAIEEYQDCEEHGNHGELNGYFFDDGVSGNRCALQLNENAWSLRLVSCLNNCGYGFLQGWKCEFYGNKIDPLDFDFLQSSISGTSIHNAIGAYYFHGTPDILLTNEHDALAVTSFNDECIPKIIENSKKPLNPYQIKNIYMPQKIGQVVVQAHFLASAALLRHALSESFPSAITSKGLLIDKVTGGYHVEFVTEISSNPVPAYVVLKRQA